MVKTAIRWTFILAVLLAAGPAAGWLARTIHDTEGGHACTLLLSDAPARSAFIGLGVAVVAVAVGGIGARLFSLGTGAACAGSLFLWASWYLGTVESAIRTSGDRTNLILLAVEGLALTIGAAVVGHVCGMAAASKHPVDPERPAPSGAAGMLIGAAPAGVLVGQALPAILAGAIAAAVAANLVAVNGLKGQALFAAIIAGIASGWLASSVAASGKITLRVAAPMLAMIVPAVIGPIVAKLLHGSHLVELMYADKLLPLARISPMDWAAGSLLGVPVGVAWSGVVLDVRAEESPAAAG
jgi:hypothetical protein